MTTDARLVGKPNEPRDERLYRRILFVRRFEERLLELFDQGELNGTTHCCIGQEANCVGVIEHLTADDHVFSNHRCHGHYLAKTGDAVGLLAEIMGRESGVCGGIGGSQHLCSSDFKSNGILGGTVPQAAGIALAFQLRESASLSVAFVGDGTFGEGVVYESLNIASLWHLPLLVVVEDNGWSQSTPRHTHMAGTVRERIEAFMIPVAEIESTDVLAISQLAEDEVRKARHERGPRAVVIQTYRLCHHSKNDDDRPRDEVQRRWKRDPLVVHGSRLGTHKRELIEQEVEQALAEVVERARSLP